MKDIRDRIVSRLEDGKEFFPAPGDPYVAVMPTVSLRNHPPRMRDANSLSCIPGVVVFRHSGTIGFSQNTIAIGVLWELFHPPYDGIDNGNYYMLGEENVSRADQMMLDCLHGGRAINDWDIDGVISVQYGNEEGAHVEGFSTVLYTIRANNFRR